MEKSVKFNIEKMKVYLYKLKLDMGIGYKEFSVYIGGNQNTYYSRFHTGRIKNKTFRQLRVKLKYAPKFDDCFELTEDQKEHFDMK